MPAFYVRGQSSGARLDVTFVCFGLMAHPLASTGF